jgi:hypothetical protein
LYPEAQPWWTFADYQVVLDLLARFRPRTVLEFGPGSSTLALLEGGARLIETCEDDAEWADVYADRLVGRFPQRVRLHRYANTDPIVIPALAAARFDCALVDGPRYTENRPRTIAYAAARTDTLICHDAASAPVRERLDALGAAGWHLEFFETDPPYAIGLARRRAAC